MTKSLVAVKFNGKHTGNHKANNAQRLTEVKLTNGLNSSLEVTSSFNFSLDQFRFAAAAIGNEEMACPADDREVADYNREITNQIVVD